MTNVYQPEELATHSAETAVATELAAALQALVPSLVPPNLVPGSGGVRNSLVSVLRSTVKYRRHPDRQYQFSRNQPAGLVSRYR